MKKICLLAAMALIMMSCSSNDEENYPADELLAGTEWRYGTFHDGLHEKPVDDISVGIVYDDFYKHFPDIIYTKGEVHSTERCDTTILGDEHYGAKLTFSGNRCILYEENYENIKIKKTETNIQTTTYVAQNLTSVLTPYYRLEVTKDAIIIYMTDPYTGEQTSSIYRTLHDFQYTAKWENELSTEYETILNSQNSETFSYQRNGNEVILTNSSKKWIGTLDTDAWTLSFVQIIPEKKELPTFSLK